MRISIVTPSFNQARFLEQCLQSVAAQRHGDVEHIVFDGGSTDGSVDILRRWSASVRWQSQPDGGQAEAINRAIAESNGEIVGWLNSDDFYHAGAFDSVLAAFQDDSVDVVFGQADYADIHGRVYARYPTEPWSHARLIETCFVCQPALFFRRRIITRVGLLDENLQYCMDYDYWLRFAQAALEVRYIPVKLAVSRMHAACKSMRSRVPMHAEINGMLRARLGAAPDPWLLSYGDAVASQWVARARFKRCHALAMVLATLFAALRVNGSVGKPMMRHIAVMLGKGMRIQR